jgi:hypothetical protein
MAVLSFLSACWPLGAPTVKGQPGAPSSRLHRVRGRVQLTVYSFFRLYIYNTTVGLASIIICSKFFFLKFHCCFLSALFMFQAYSLTTLSNVQRSAIRDLAELGLVKLQQVKNID